MENSFGCHAENLASIQYEACPHYVPARSFAQARSFDKLRMTVKRAQDDILKGLGLS